VEKVGGKRIFIIHGTDDRMLVFKHFEVFKEEIGEDKGVEYRVWEGAGHVLPWEVESEFNEYVEDVIRRTGEMGDD
jgi:pimeloyl-ACP methyl ester carboxylesterase